MPCINMFEDDMPTQKLQQQEQPCVSPHTTCCSCRVFRKAGAIDPALSSHTDSLQLGPATNPRHRLPFKLHYSNVGCQMLLKQGWEEGKGLGHDAKGRADPYVPTHQYGGHLGLGCLRYKATLTGKGAENEIRVCAPAALILHPLLFCLSVSKHVRLYVTVPVCACMGSFHLSIIFCVSL